MISVVKNLVCKCDQQPTPIYEILTKKDTIIQIRLCLFDKSFVANGLNAIRRLAEKGLPVSEEGYRSIRDKNEDVAVKCENNRWVKELDTYSLNRT